MSSAFEVSVEMQLQIFSFTKGRFSLRKMSYCSIRWWKQRVWSSYSCCPLSHRTFVNGSSVSSPIQLHHGDRILWGNNHFFRYGIAHISEGGRPLKTVFWNRSHFNSIKMIPYYVCSHDCTYMLYSWLVCLFIYMWTLGAENDMSLIKSTKLTYLFNFLSSVRFPPNLVSELIYFFFWVCCLSVILSAHCYSFLLSEKL